MDDDSDCDIYAAVTAYCNSNQLDKILENIQPEKDDEDGNLDRERIAEIEKLCEYKSTRRKSTRRSRGRGRGSGRATETGENDTSLTSECGSQESLPTGSGRGRGRRRRGAKTQAEQNNVEPSSSTPQTTMEIAPQQSATEVPQSSRRANRTARRLEGGEGPVVAVINLGCDSDSDSGTPLVPIFAPRRGRARRDFLARKAADLAAKSVVDVRSSLSGNESSDHENTSAVAGLEDSFDSLNPEVSVKIWWNDKIEKFTMRKYQKFSEIIKILADREQTSCDNVFLRIDAQIIKPTDSPDSINYKIHQFIYAKVIKNSVLPRYDLEAGERKRKDPNLLELKVQSNAWKKPLMISMRKEESFKVLYAKCAEELKMPYDNIKLYFDGDHIQFADTPQDLELEGQEVIDCQLV